MSDQDRYAKYKEYHANYRRAHKEERNTYFKKYRQTHKEKARLYDARYRIAQPELFDAALRKKLMNVLGDKCVKCGFNDMRALQVDHVNGGGGQEYRTFGNRRRMIQYYLAHLDEARQKLQVLCANCNWIKKYENDEYYRPPPAISIGEKDVEALT